MIVTQEVNLFRETARHLWNTYLREDADFDTVDVFRNICRILFCEKIVSRLGINAPPIPVETDGNYLPQYKIFMTWNGQPGKLPLYVNRDLPPSGYWDYPIDWIPPEEDHDIRPICFFDFENEWRMLEFYRVRIVNCGSHPELTGRDALIYCKYVDIEVIDDLPEYKGPDDCQSILNLHVCRQR